MAKNKSLPGSRGVATLIVVMVVLFASTILFFGTNRNTITSIQISRNYTNQAQAQEAARGGLDYGQAYLGKSGISLTATPAITVGTFSVSISFIVPSPTSNHVTIKSVATNGDATATAFLKVKRDPGLSFNQASSSPWVVSGCIDFTSNANYAAPASGGSTVFLSGQSPTNTACINADSRLQRPAGTQISYGNNISSAWTYIFGSTLAELKAVAASGTSNSVFYFDQSFTVQDKWNDVVSLLDPSPSGGTILGSSTSPKIFIFDAGSGCEQNNFNINGNITVWGIVYFAQGCTATGFGNLTLNGLLLAEGGTQSSTPLKVTANAQWIGWTQVTNAELYNIPPSVSRIPGSWKDF